MEVRDRIIAALDVDSLDKVKFLVESLAPHIGCFKVGLELLTAVGAPKVVKFIHSLGGQVFYDGSFNALPNTVGGAAQVVAGLNVKMFSIHASAGVEAMKAAVANKEKSLVFAVTVLTSLTAKDLWDLGYVDSWQAESWARYRNETKERYIPKLVANMTTEAKKAGVDGIICSPQELQFFRERVNVDSVNLLKITPGVRPKWAPADDQKRLMTPSEAVKAGADYLVIGRPITQPPPEIGTPAEAVKRISEEIVSAL